MLEFHKEKKYIIMNDVWSWKYSNSLFILHAVLKRFTILAGSLFQKLHFALDLCLEIEVNLSRDELKIKHGPVRMCNKHH